MHDRCCMRPWIDDPTAAVSRVGDDEEAAAPPRRRERREVWRLTEGLWMPEA
jgi:hypothetical protein